MQEYRNFAFISYNKSDIKWGYWLQKKIENYRIPKEFLIAKPGVLKERIRPVFLDKTDISVGNLSTTIQNELINSEFLIVICSPNAAKSAWVNQEIIFFKKTGRESNIIPFIVSGSPNTAFNNEEQCYPPALDKNILGASIFVKSKEEALIRVLAKLLSVDFDKLYRRQKRRFFFKNSIVFTICIFITTIISFLLFREKKYKEQQKIEFQKAQLNKANYLFSNAEKNSLSNPNLAFLLFVNSYILNPDSLKFDKLISFYESNLKVYENNDKSQSYLGTFNMFYRTINPQFEYDIDSNDSDMINLKVDDLVQFSLEKNIIITSDHNKFYIKDFKLNDIQQLNLDSLVVLNWKYNSFNNSLVMHCKNISSKRNDIYVYNIKKQSLKSLYYNRPNFNRDTILGYYFDLDFTDYKKPSDFYNKGIETNLNIFIPGESNYAIIYYDRHMNEQSIKKQKRYTIINCFNYIDSSGVVFLPAPSAKEGNYEHNTILSSDPTSQYMIIRFKSSYYAFKDCKVLGFDLYPPIGADTLYNSEQLDTKDISAIHWIFSNNRYSLCMGKEEKGIEIKGLNRNTNVELYNDSYEWGKITSIVSNKNYIIAGTSNGYIVG